LGKLSVSSFFCVIISGVPFSGLSVSAKGWQSKGVSCSSVSLVR
jgi:hypothetical protein